MKVGYARVSTRDQRLDFQRNALRRQGCSRVFQEKTSGICRQRPALRSALRHLRRGDVLVVWKLDRLGRSLQHLMEILQELERRGIGFCSISDNIDTTTAIGKLVFHIIGAVAEFERSLISERTKAGMQVAKHQGQRLGRTRRMSARQVELARRLCERGGLTQADIAARFKVGRTTLWRSMRRSGEAGVPPDQ